MKKFNYKKAKERIEKMRDVDSTHLSGLFKGGALSVYSYCLHVLEDSVMEIPEEYCRWRLLDIDRITYHPQCKKGDFQTLIIPEEIKYCPYCGKIVKIKEDLPAKFLNDLSDYDY